MAILILLYIPQLKQEFMEKNVLISVSVFNVSTGVFLLMYGVKFVNKAAAPSPY